MAEQQIQLVYLFKKPMAIIYEKIQQLLVTYHMSAKIILDIFLLVCLANAEQFRSNYFTLKANPNCTVADCTSCPLFNNSCTQCDPSFYTINNTTCISCNFTLVGCADCTYNNINENLTCNRCDKGYVLVKTNCRQCSNLIPNCAKCLQDETCQTCDSNFVPIKDATQCQACRLFIKNCITCNNINFTCDTCGVGTYRNKNGAACTNCSNNISRCVACNVNANGSIITCTQCNQFSVLSNNSCLSCNIFILNCNTCHLNGMCDQCDTGFYSNANSTKCLQCSTTLIQCAQCTPFEKNLACTRCNTDYFLQGSDCISCEMMIPQCLSCNSINKTCQQCDDYYFRNNSGRSCDACIAAIPGCLACYAKNKDGTNVKCQSCKQNFFFINASYCQPCGVRIENCDQCDIIHNVCLTCVARYYLDEYLDSTCQSCNGRIPNCIACSGTIVKLTCSACDGALVVFKNNCTTCSDVIADCAQCHQESLYLNIMCIQCKNGKGLALDGLQCFQIQNSSMELIILAIAGGVVILGIIFLVVCIIQKKKLDSLKSSLSQVTSNDSYFKKEQKSFSQ